jgi:hypothetical protein
MRLLTRLICSRLKLSRFTWSSAGCDPESPARLCSAFLCYILATHRHVPWEGEVTHAELYSYPYHMVSGVAPVMCSSARTHMLVRLKQKIGEMRILHIHVRNTIAPHRTSSSSQLHEVIHKQNQKGRSTYDVDRFHYLAAN